MNYKELDKRVRERKSRLQIKETLVNIGLLLPPIILEMTLCIASIFSYLIPILLTYFVLPMFYTVERRMRAQLTGIGNKYFSYTDGYKAFFTSAQGGIFGIILAFISMICLIILFSLIFSVTFGPISNAYGVYNVFERARDLMISNDTTSLDLSAFIVEEGYQLTGPATIFIGIIMFFPLFYFFFVAIDLNLEDHYIATIVLPDIDKNISASQARAIARGNFRKMTFGRRFNNAIKYNWYYYLLYIAIYCLTVYGMSQFAFPNVYVMRLLITAAPIFSISYGLIINYFCLVNNYSAIEENQKELLDKISTPIKISIYQTYCNPNYIHGEESQARGSFIPADILEGSTIYKASDNQNTNTDFNDDSYSGGVVINFSNDKKEGNNQGKEE